MLGLFVMMKSVLTLIWGAAAITVCDNRLRVNSRTFNMSPSAGFVQALIQDRSDLTKP